MWHDPTHPWPCRPPITRKWWLVELEMRHAVGRVIPRRKREGRVIAVIESETKED